MKNIKLRKQSTCINGRKRTIVDKYIALHRFLNDIGYSTDEITMNDSVDIMYEIKVAIKKIKSTN